MKLDGFVNHLAVVIGINDYQNGVPRLKTPVNDAQTIAEILKSSHGFEVELLLNEAATHSTLLNLLQTHLPQRLTKEDRLLFYFAGHGIALNGDDGPEGYVIPQDASMGVMSTYLSMAQVNKALLQLPCRHFLGILDCCFAGAFRWSSTRKLMSFESGMIHKERFDRFIQDPAWQVITSAASDQLALDAFELKNIQRDRDMQGKHSPFAEAFIEALQGHADAYPPSEAGKPAGDGVITATELYLYLRDRVEPDTEDRAIRQTPGIFPLNNHDKGEFIFLSPGHPLNLPPAPPLDVSSNPYRGLQAFDEAHKDLFFGRAALTQTLAEFVKGHSLTVVLGASGSGKSSLVKAGVIPRLRQENNWYFLEPFRPGESPLRPLNQALELFSLQAINVNRTESSSAPVEGATSIIYTPNQILAQWFEGNPQAHLMIIVDQLEELITLCREEEERKDFLELLANAIAKHPNHLHLVLTLRSDFEPQFRNTPLESSWLSSRFVVPAMSREELRQAIEEPASARVMYFAPQKLVDQLIDEVANMPGALPLLSFALSELYLNYLKRQDNARKQGKTIDRAITNIDYETIGGVTRSLTQRAEQEYAFLVRKDSVYEHTIRNIMLRMVSVGSELARRRVPLSELKFPEPENGRVDKAIKRFEDARLLTPNTDPEGQPYIEPAHDVLVLGWQRLSQWKQQDLANLVLQRELNPTANKWKLDKKNKQATGFLWDDDPRLPQLQQLLRSENSWLNQAEIEFVEQSSKRKAKNRLILISIVTTLFFILSGAAIFSRSQQILAEGKTKEALVATDLAKKRKITADYEAYSARKSAYEVGISETKAKFSTKEAQVQRGKALNNQRKAEREKQRAEKQTIIAKQEKQRAEKQTIFAQTQRQRAEQQTTVAQLREQAARVFNLIPTANAVPGLILAIDTMKRSQSFPAVELIAQASLLSAVQVSQEVNRLLGHMSAVHSMAFSLDGKRIVSGSYDQTLRIWDAQTGQQIGQPFLGHTSGVSSVAFSPDGKRIVSGSRDNTQRIWDAQTGQPIGQPLQGHTDSVHSMAFSPDGKRIVSSSKDNTLRIWDAQTGQPIGQQLRGHTSGVSSAAFSPDGKRIVSGSNDNTLRIWDAQTGQPIGQPFLGHTSYVYSVAFSPDGKRIVSGSNDKTLRIWDAQTGQPIGQPLQGHMSSVLSVAFSPDGKRIVSGSADNTLRIWDASPESWFAIACNRLHYHPLLNEQERVIIDPEFLKVVRRARVVCQQKV
jgi:WD40 repeat protein